MPLYMDLHSLDVVTFEDVGKATRPTCRSRAATTSAICASGWM